MRGMTIFQKPSYREIRPMRGRPMRGPPVAVFTSFFKYNNNLNWLYDGL